MPDITTRPSERHRRTPSPELVSAIAYHEAGHAVATVLAFRTAAWLPKPIIPNNQRNRAYCYEKSSLNSPC